MRLTSGPSLCERRVVTVNAAGDGAGEFRPRLFHERQADERPILAEPCAAVVDQLPPQRAELSQLWPIRDTGAVDEPVHWAYYPWRRAVMSILGRDASRLLRLDRNRYKIAQKERRLGRLTIGVLGLSVGHPIAHTLALEGLCGEIRIAGYDTFAV
jgi:hypothetical protein